MARIEVTPLDHGKREILVNGISIPDVVDVTAYVRPGEVDTVALTLRADSFNTVNFK